MRYTAAQKRAYALKMAKRRRGGKAAYKRVLYSKAKGKVARATTRSIIKKELNKRVETYMNASRLSLSNFQEATPSFGSACYFFGNLGGPIPATGQSFVPMNTIAAKTILGVGGGTASSNQVYTGKEIFGKHFHSTITLTLPSIRTQPTGGSDWQDIPTNYEYRAVFFKTKHRPGAGPSQSGQSQAPMYTLLSNEVGTKFGPLSPDSDCVPEANAATGIWLNNDLCRQRLNRTQWNILHEKRGRLSVGSSMSATSNNASVTSGQTRYPSEAVLHFNMPINKKIQLNLSDVPAAQQNPAVAQPALDYNTTIFVAIFLNPLGEPTLSEQTWNEKISPYINISNTFTWTDM